MGLEMPPNTYFKLLAKITVCKGIKKKTSTLKNVIVDPPSKVPYDISVCSAKSDALSMGVIIRSTVRKAAKFAVYDDIIIKQKKNQHPPTILVEVAYNKKNIYNVLP